MEKYPCAYSSAKQFNLLKSQYCLISIKALTIIKLYKRPAFRQKLLSSSPISTYTSLYTKLCIYNNFSFLKLFFYTLLHLQLTRRIFAL